MIIDPYKFETGVFSPTDITGLSLWLDGDDSSTLWANANRTTPASLGGRVHIWDDKSPNANHGSQAASQFRPVRQASGFNSRDALRFDSDYLESIFDTALTQTSAKSIFFAYSSDSNTANNSAFNLHHATPSEPVGTRHSLFYNISPAPKLGTAFLGGYKASATTIPNGLPFIHTVTDEGLGNKDLDEVVYNNKTVIPRTEGANPTIATDFATPWRLGNWNNDANQLLYGYACEIIVYDSVLNASQLNNVHTYLMDKWGIV